MKLANQAAHQGLLQKQLHNIFPNIDILFSFFLFLYLFFIISIIICIY